MFDCLCRVCVLVCLPLCARAFASVCMCAFVRVCMIMCLCAWVHVCLHVYVSVCLCGYVSVYVCVCTYVTEIVCKCVCVHMSFCVCVCVYVCARVSVSMGNPLGRRKEDQVDTPEYVKHSCLYKTYSFRAVNICFCLSLSTHPPQFSMISQQPVHTLSLVLRC